MKSGNLTHILEHDSDISRLGDYLRRADYSSEAICDALGIEGASHQVLTNTGYCALVYYDEARTERSDLAALGTMLALGGWIKKRTYERVFPQDIRSILEKYEFVSDADGEYKRSTVALVEFGSCFFLSDRMLERSPDSIRLTQQGHDHVDPPNYSSVSLAKNALEPPTFGDSRFLDVGCGTGCQSIFASADHREVVGIDITDRAVQFSKINATLNGMAVTFKQHDCLLFEDGAKFDRIVFNVPSVPQYKPDLDKVDTYTSKFGYGLAIQFANSRLLSLLSENGICRIWSVFAVRSTDRTILEIIQRELEDFEAFDIEVTIEGKSPFGLSQQDIEQKKISRDSYLLADPSHRKIYVDFLESNDIIRIAPALITITWKKSVKNAVSAREVETLVP